MDLVQELSKIESGQSPRAAVLQCLARGYVKYDRRPVLTEYGVAVLQAASRK